MKIYELRRSQLIPKNREDVFSFFQDPANLAKITPPQLGFQILTPLPIPMAKGRLIDYTVRVLGLPVRWTSLIEEYDPPHNFVDVQLRGPYSYWHHRHMFKDHPEGTLVEDVVHYALPLGPLGRLVHKLFVRRKLADIFNFREKCISGRFQSSADAKATRF